VGHFEINSIRYQIVDTPGLLDRPFAQRNEIELQAISALRHLGDVLLIIVDPTGTCGYELDEQIKLVEEIGKHIDMPVLVAANKSDLSGEIAHERFDVSISTLTGDGVDALKNRLVSMIDMDRYSAIENDMDTYI
jgi:nucleolar GTP-binding protein